MNINVDAEVFQVLDGISYLDVTLDLKTLNFSSSLALVLSLHLPSYVCALFLQIGNLSTQIPNILHAIPPEIDPLVVSSRVVIFPVVLLVKVIFMVITIVCTAVMLLFPMFLSVYLKIRRFGDSKQ